MFTKGNKVSFNFDGFEGFLINNDLTKTFYQDNTKIIQIKRMCDYKMKIKLAWILFTHQIENNIIVCKFL